MDKSVVFMFAGLGSQYFGMGKDLFQSHPTFRQEMHRLDEIIMRQSGLSVVDVLYDGTKANVDTFEKTLHASLALFSVENALANTLIALGVQPNYVLGYSLGEYTAAAVSGVLPTESIVSALIEQANLSEKNCTAGAMLAVLGDYKLFETTPALNRNAELVSASNGSHFVIAGRREALNVLHESLTSRDRPYQLLWVTRPFHTSLMDPMEREFKDFLARLSYSVPRIPIASCACGKLVSSITKEHYWNVIRRPIQYRETIEELERNRAGESTSNVYIDLGPSNTLSALLKDILSPNTKSDVRSIMSAFGGDARRLNELLRTMPKRAKRRTESGEVQKMLAYVFPGQGSQKKGMGEGLFDEYKDDVAAADAVLGYSIRDLCLQNPRNELGQTQFTQPALYVVSALTYRNRLRTMRVKPDYVAGHSLGEYCALLAAGAFSFETGLRLVKKRGELMREARGGGMAAVVGLSEEAIRTVLRDQGLNSTTIANYNSPSQIVISGTREEIVRGQLPFEKAGASMYIPLNVSGAFHSPHMRAAREEFEKFLESVEFFDLKLPVISNVHATPHCAADIKRNLADQMTSPVKWTDTVRYLLQAGCSTFEEIGPGRALTDLIAKIREHAQLKPVETQGVAETTLREPETGSGGRCEKSTTPQAHTRVFKEPSARSEPQRVCAESLGCQEYKKEYNVTYAYVAGGMYRGIASEELVIKMARAGMMAYFGTGGLSLANTEKAIRTIQKELKAGEAWGMNLMQSATEEQKIELYLKHEVRNIEAAAFIHVTPALVKYRLKGLDLDGQGRIVTRNRIMAKVSRPEVARAFLSPPPEKLVRKLLEENAVTREQASLSTRVAMADDICAEADSGGHTDGAVGYVLLPSITRLRDSAMEEHRYEKRVRVGAAGGIGTPEAAAAAFILGADFILTGSINQCTVEARTSETVKDMLQDVDVYDTTYAPAGDMFESGAKVQVLKKGVFFPMRANKLYEIYQRYGSIDEIDDATKKLIEEKYFKRSLSEVLEEVGSFAPMHGGDKSRMSMIFRWYFSRATDLALNGRVDDRIDFQVMCGPALGAFNQWVKGTDLECWRNRHVDAIGVKLMTETASLLSQRISALHD